MINLVQNPITNNAGNSEWEVIYSSDYGTSFQAYHAFDNNEDSRFLFSTNTGGYIGLLKKDTIPVFLERITYRSKIAPNQSSPIFIIQIYNGTEWVNHQNVNLGSLSAQEYIIDLDVPLFVLGVRLFFLHLMVIHLILNFLVIYTHNNISLKKTMNTNLIMVQIGL